MFKLPHNCSHLTRQGTNAQNSLSQASFKLNLEKAEEPEITLPTSVGSSIKQDEFQNYSWNKMYKNLINIQITNLYLIQNQ